MNKISKKIFIIVFLVLLSSIILSIIFQINSYKHELDIISKNSLSITEKSFADILTNETRKLSLALDFLIDDKIAKEYFIKKDIDNLFDYSKPIFDKIKIKYNITHLYYIMPEHDRTCFLRVHNRDKNKDLITRFTYKNAVKTKKTASGLELGKTAFALRVVKPYYDDKQNLIGYMEVGQEIDNFFENIKKKTGDEFIVTVNKKYLDEQKWNTAKKTNSNMSSWNYLKNEVKIASTSKKISLSKINLYNIPDKSKIIDKQFKINDKVYVLSQIPLIDAGDRKVGAIYSLHDITTQYNRIINSVIKIISIFLLLMVLFGTITIFLIQKYISKPIEKVVISMKKIANKEIDFIIKEKRKDEIGDLYNSINKITINLRTIISIINSTVKAVLNASEQLNKESQQTSQRASKQAYMTEKIFDSMKQIVKTIDSNTKDAEHTEEITNKSLNKLKNSSKVFKQTIQSISDISQKITIIADVANKTDILSINADIAAAKAGEKGKLFKVVAKEIRKLADKTKIESQEIDKLSTSSNIISQIAERTLEKLIPEIIQNTEKLNNIVLASKEQQIVAGNINNSIQQLTELTNENSLSSEEISNSSEELYTQVEQLKKLISLFKI